MARQADKLVRPAVLGGLGMGMVLACGIPPATEGLAAQDKALPNYVAAEPTYETGFDEPLIELRFTLPVSRGTKHVVAVRLMQRGGTITQSFLVPGSARAKPGSAVAKPG